MQHLYDMQTIGPVGIDSGKMVFMMFLWIAIEYGLSLVGFLVYEWLSYRRRGQEVEAAPIAHGATILEFPLPHRKTGTD